MTKQPLLKVSVNQTGVNKSVDFLEERSSWTTAALTPQGVAGAHLQREAKQPLPVQGRTTLSTHCLRREHRLHRYGRRHHV